MTFVNELIPESEKEKFPFSVDTRPSGYKPTLWKWTIDRERDAILVHTFTWGGGYEGTQPTKDFVMKWEGFLIDISATPLPCTQIKTVVAMSWRINKINIPIALQDRQEELFELIRNAFTTMGDIYDGEQYDAVNVDFELTNQGIKP